MDFIRLGACFCVILAVFSTCPDPAFRQDQTARVFYHAQDGQGNSTLNQPKDQAASEFFNDDSDREIQQISEAWQQELQLLAKSKINFVRLACDLTPQQLSVFWESIEPRLRGMNDLILYEIEEGPFIVLEEADIFGVALAEKQPSDILEEMKDEAREMEHELDQIEQKKDYDAQVVKAVSSDGISLKQNPYTRLDQEFRKVLKPIITPEQLAQYDHECSVRDQFRRETITKIIVSNLCKLLQLDDKQEEQIRQVILENERIIDDLDISSYLYDKSVIPIIDEAAIKRCLTVRQRGKWNRINFHNYPLQLQTIEVRFDEDE